VHLQSAPLVVVSQSRRLSAGQDTIPAPPQPVRLLSETFPNTPDGLLALHFVNAHCEPTTNGRILALTAPFFSLWIFDLCNKRGETE